MPELPEVETIRRQLEKALVGQIVSEVDVLSEKSFCGDAKILLGMKVIGVRRRGKGLVIDLINVKFINQNSKKEKQNEISPLTPSTFVSATADRPTQGETPCQIAGDLEVTGGCYALKNESVFATPGLPRAQIDQELVDNLCSRNDDFAEKISLVIHLKMTGQLIYESYEVSDEKGTINRLVGGHPTEDFVQSLPSKHTRVVIRFMNYDLGFMNEDEIPPLAPPYKGGDELGPLLAPSNAAIAMTDKPSQGGDEDLIHNAKSKKEIHGEIQGTKARLGERTPGLPRAQIDLNLKDNLCSRNDVDFEGIAVNTLFFNDQRRFGWVKMVKTEDLEKMDFVAKLGREPWNLGNEEFFQSLQKSRVPIKVRIMDQAVIVGVGNIYANDALWEARIDPRREAKGLTRAEAVLLLEKIKMVLDEGIKYGGATALDKKYVDLQGLGGKYQEHFRVYERVGLPCLRDGCAGVIRKIKLGGRGTYWCEECQK